MENNFQNAPNIAFLGVSDKVSNTINISNVFLGLNVLNLRRDVVNFIYPMNLESFSLIIAIYGIKKLDDAEIIGFSDKHGKIFNLKLSFEIKRKKIGSAKENEISVENDSQSNGFWGIIPLKFPKNTVILEPEVLKLYFKKDDFEIQIGEVFFIFAETPKLNEERIRAIKSNPRAAKNIKMFIRCNLCKDEISIVTGIDRTSLKENDIWYEDAEDFFKCNCGKHNINLKFLKKGISYYLGNPISMEKTNYSFVQLYEKHTLKTILANLIETLESNPGEEVVQKFFEENTILFHMFSPLRIIYKAAILQKFKTDFAILSSDGLLYLIEIEKPSKLILKKDGGRTSEFNHAFDQIIDWLSIIKEHRLAVLDTLEINPKMVTKIKGVVIYGRERDCDQKELLKLKSSEFGDIDFYTYDDIIGKLETLINDFHEI